MDNEISSIGIEETKNGIEKFVSTNDKNERKRIRKALLTDKHVLSVVETNIEIMHINLIKDMTETGRHLMRSKYLEFIDAYDGTLNAYNFVVNFSHAISTLKGQFPSKNDTIDILHLIYVHDDVTIVSDDEIFCELSTETKMLKTMKIDEFSKKFYKPQNSSV